jgi:hypothetical protein
MGRSEGRWPLPEINCQNPDASLTGFREIRTDKGRAPVSRLHQLGISASLRGFPPGKADVPLTLTPTRSFALFADTGVRVNVIDA